MAKSLSPCHPGGRPRPRRETQAEFCSPGSGVLWTFGNGKSPSFSVTLPKSKRK